MRLQFWDKDFRELFIVIGTIYWNNYGNPEQYKQTPLLCDTPT
jgi:hypothetical protein